jgi:acyl-CoA thioesterase FadM
MSRIKIDLPPSFTFFTSIPIRITDINYGGHAGNDSFLSLIHEVRMQFLKTKGYTEMNMCGVGMIMADVGIEFRNELFYGDIVHASVTVSAVGKVSFDIYYKLEKEAEGKKILVALAKTAMVCYDYSRKKIVSIPDEAKTRLVG